MPNPYPIDELNPYSPLRVWLFNALRTSFPVDGLWEDTRPEFYQWTWMTHKSCLHWFKADPGFTTCTSFLHTAHKKIQMAGKSSAPFFIPFGLHQCGRGHGWHTLAEADQEPQDGDFFQIGTPVHVKHVGILHRVFGGACTTIAGGADIRGVCGRIRRSTGVFPPANLMGWLNIEEFYAGWKGGA
jgi:hypothetical protein